MDPFGIFPVKVWEEILRRLEIPLDKLNLIKINRSLEQLELFQECGDEWHFAAVIGIVLSYLNGGNANLKKPWHDNEGLKSAVVNCRLVSKSVKEVVDSFVKLHWENYSYNAPSTTTIHPLDMLPFLVCENMLAKLENPVDKLNLIKACPHLEQFSYYQKKKIEWGFSAILKPFLKNFYLKNRSYGAELKSAVRNCRLVCKGTKKIVDNFADFYWETVGRAAPFAFPFPLNCLEHVDKCLAQADQLQRNNRSASPFISGGLLYIFCGERWNFVEHGNVVSARPSLEKAAQLVSHPNIGINLRGLRILVKRADDLQGTCNFVRNLLHSIPNIVNLSINLFPAGNVNRAEPEMDVHPLPELPHLKHLEVNEDIDGDYEGYSLLRDSLDMRQYFIQLKGLEMSILLWKKTYTSLSVQFPQLKYFMFHHIPITGWDSWIWNIIANFRAPALQMLILKTENIDLEEDGEEYISFNKFVTENVLNAIQLRRRNQYWRLTPSQYGTPDSTTFTYKFVHRGWIVRRQ